MRGLADPVDPSDSTLIWHVLDAFGAHATVDDIPTIVGYLDHGDLDVVKAARTALSRLGAGAETALLAIVRARSAGAWY